MSECARSVRARRHLPNAIVQASHIGVVLFWDVHDEVLRLRVSAPALFAFTREPVVVERQPGLH